MGGGGGGVIAAAAGYAAQQYHGGHQDRKEFFHGGFSLSDYFLTGCWDYGCYYSIPKGNCNPILQDFFIFIHFNKETGRNRRCFGMEMQEN